MKTCIDKLRISELGNSKNAEVGFPHTMGVLIYVMMPSCVVSSYHADLNSFTVTLYLVVLKCIKGTRHHTVSMKKYFIDEHFI